MPLSFLSFILKILLSFPSTNPWKNESFYPQTVNLREVLIFRLAHTNCLLNITIISPHCYSHFKFLNYFPYLWLYYRIKVALWTFIFWSNQKTPEQIHLQHGSLPLSWILICLYCLRKFFEFMDLPRASYFFESICYSL